MRLRDVDDQKVRHVPEVLDELLELVQLEHEGGSGAAPEAEHQRPATCRREKVRRRSQGSNPRRASRATRTLHEPEDAGPLPIHGDHR